MLGILSTAARKEITIYWRYPADVLALAARPLVGVLPYWLLASYIFGGTSETFLGITGLKTAKGFVIIGYLVWWSMQNLMLDASLIVEREMRQGTLGRLLLSPVPIWKIFVSHGIGSVAKDVAPSFIVIICAIALLAENVAPRQYGVVAFVFLLSVFPVYGFGLILAAVTMRSRTLQYAFMTTSLLAFLAGPAYSISLFPNWMQWLAYMSPLTHAVQGLRSTLTGAQSVASLPWTLLALAGFGAVLLPIGLYCLKSVVSDLKRLGQIEYH